MKPAATDFEVWEENAEVFGLFLRLRTQWRIINNVVAGLDYTAIGVMLDIFAVKDKPAFFDDLQAMELSALAEMNKGKD